MLNSIAQLALTVDVNGESVDFPRLDMRDLAIFGQEIIRRRLEQADKIAKENKVSGFELMSVKQEIMDRFPDINAIYLRAANPADAQWLCTHSLKKSGKTAEEAEKIVNDMESLVMVQTAQVLITCQKKKAPVEESNAKNV